MANLKLITRIAEIEGLEFTVDNGVVYTKQLNDKYDSNIRMPYDPMDDGVNHRLMIKYKVNVRFYIDGSICAYTVFSSDGFINENINEAVLLCIEEAHSD